METRWNHDQSTAVKRDRLCRNERMQRGTKRGKEGQRGTKRGKEGQWAFMWENIQSAWSCARGGMRRQGRVHGLGLEEAVDEDFCRHMGAEGIFPQGSLNHPDIHWRDSTAGHKQSRRFLGDHQRQFPDKNGRVDNKEMSFVTPHRQWGPSCEGQGC